MKKPIVVIIGAGPAGLTAANELIDKTDFLPVVYEADDVVGGISRTVVHNGNRMDLGGHRFFSKSQRALDWWNRMIPFPGATDSVNPPDPDSAEPVMLRRVRKSSILFEGRLYPYPISFRSTFIFHLGLFRSIRIALSYIRVRLTREHEILTLEDLFILRFGKVLYKLFFHDFTEKVWGRPCNQISADWGHQRIKNLSVAKTVTHALRRIFSPKDNSDPSRMETSLINRFYYPPLGPGQLWDIAARRVSEGGGQIHLRHHVTGFEVEDRRIKSVIVENGSGGRVTIEPDWVISSMPVPELIEGMGSVVPTEISNLASRLDYRELIVVGVLLRRFGLTRRRSAQPMPDQWIYVQEHSLRIGRIQIFNNWSPFLVRDPNTVWIGLEYFCTRGDAFWSLTDGELKQFAGNELISAGFTDRDDLLDAAVARVPRAYPAYWGGYDRFSQIRAFTDSIDNLFLIGRNGMHRYNNQDHSMLTAMAAVENIAAGRVGKSNIWEVNTEKKPHDRR